MYWIGSKSNGMYVGRVGDPWRMRCRLYVVTLLFISPSPQVGSGFRRMSHVIKAHGEMHEQQTNARGGAPWGDARRGGGKLPHEQGNLLLKSLCPGCAGETPKVRY